MKLTITFTLFVLAFSSSFLQHQPPIYCYIQNCQLCDFSGLTCYYCLPDTDCCSYNCSSCVNSIACVQCDDGFTLEQNLCIPNNTCTSQNETCSICSNQTCLGCIEGYWLSQAGNLCLACQPHCLNCTSSQVCSICESTFFIQAYKDVQICISCSNFNCKQCTDDLNCTLCLSSFYLTQNLTCLSCFPCIVCNSPNNCSQCSMTYYLVDKTCQSCPANCSTCTDSQNCTECLNGYYLQDFNCKLCSQPCDLCDSKENCTSCVDKYFLNNTQCLPCPQYCLDCANQTSCNSCIFLSTNGTCCSSNCSKCDSVDLLLSNCTTCFLGYFLNESQITVNKSNYSLFNCEPCPSQCLECISSNNCSTCIPGYYNSEGQCLSCSAVLALCQECLNNNSCLVCRQGELSSGNCICLAQQYFTGFSCIECPNECSSCTNQVTCTACQINYQLQGSSCVAPSSSGFPWWAILLIVLGVATLAILAGVCYRQYGKKKPAQSAYSLLGEGQAAGGEVIQYRRSSSIQLQ